MEDALLVCIDSSTNDDYIGLELVDRVVCVLLSGEEGEGCWGRWGGGGVERLREREEGKRESPCSCASTAPPMTTTSSWKLWVESCVFLVERKVRVVGGGEGEIERERGEKERERPCPWASTAPPKTSASSRS